jgi:hypothetical protein
MNPDTIPIYADIIPTEIAVIVLLELLFGFFYNALVAYWIKNNLMHVSWTVVIGVAVTLLIPALFWFGNTMPFWQSILYLIAFFAASGTPMIVGSMQRTVQEKDQKKRKPWPVAALRARDDAVMELNAMAADIAKSVKANDLHVQDLPDYVNRLHYVIGTLKSV